MDATTVDNETATMNASNTAHDLSVNTAGTSASLSDAGTGTLYGIGVGTGDPELLTLKALRLIQAAPVICYLINHEGHSQARHIARLAFTDGNLGQQEIPVTMPMELDRQAANRAYDQAAAAMRAHLNAGRDVAFLCEGDPLFFGSFAYVLERLQPQFNCQIVPGISTIHSASAALVAPLTRLKDSLVVISGRHDDAYIRQVLRDFDSIVIMKVARQRQRLRLLLEECGRLHEARYMAYLGREQECIVHDLRELPAEGGVYFSVMLVTRAEDTP